MQVCLRWMVLVALVAGLVAAEAEATGAEPLAPPAAEPAVGEADDQNAAATGAAAQDAAAQSTQDVLFVWERLQDDINNGFDWVTTPLELMMTWPVVSVPTVTVYEGPTADWSRVRDAIYEAGLVNWRDEPEFLTEPKEVSHDRRKHPIIVSEIVRDEQGIPVFDPDESGSIAVKAADRAAALALIDELGLRPAMTTVVAHGDRSILDRAAETLRAAGIGDPAEGPAEVVVTPPSDGTKGTVAVRLDREAEVLEILAAADFKEHELVSGANGGEQGIWLIVAVLVGGGIFFTLWYNFINVRLFKHAIECVRGKYDNPDDDGEISHFKALTSALSATVGLGNIAGVAVAIVWGGPGAVFWMWVIAFLGMTLKFNSCFLAQRYRRVKPDGSVLGGPMVYLDDGIRQEYPRIAGIGKVLGILFAVMCIMAAFGGGNMFQANQLGAMVARTFLGPGIEETAGVQFGAGFILAIFVGIVIIGGIRRIGEVTARLVPLMCGLYCAVALVIILGNLPEVPAMLSLIFTDAFAPRPLIAGGLMGVLFQAMKRAAFSNEAGLGSAAIAHAAAKTGEPVREGVVAMLGPFIDTILVCTMTALAILITKAHLQGGNGVEVTAAAFGTVLTPGVGNVVLTIMVAVFAYSTIISWSYYGERCVEYLFGNAGIAPYRIVYVLVIVFGAVISLDRVIGFADMMLLSMAFPNIIGSILLAPKVRRQVRDYQMRLKNGEMKPVV